MEKEKIAKAIKDLNLILEPLVAEKSDLLKQLRELEKKEAITKILKTIRVGSECFTEMRVGSGFKYTIMSLEIAGDSSVVVVLKGNLKNGKVREGRLWEVQVLKY